MHCELNISKMQPIHWRKNETESKNDRKVFLFSKIEFAIDKKKALLFTIFLIMAL